ncbi:MAG: hypothetical protein IK111_06875 [Lachnospiraceae bacterium]|nr:hypothetical protein [Lachnospiraceae bacterium]
MKKSSLRILIILMSLLFVTVVAVVLLTLISQIKLTDKKQDRPEKKVEDTVSDASTETPKPVIEENIDETADNVDEEISADEPDPEAFYNDDTGDENADTDKTFKANSPSEPLRVVWLGDSLTQGSLGDDNGNVDNPQAPWRVLKEISGYDVEGFGYYGFYTHDILWKWGNDGGEKDPDTVYVFWVGSCDFRESQGAVTTVIKEIDTFLRNGHLDKYIVMGTTPREELGVSGARNVNQKLEDKYGDKYLDILPYVVFGPDNLHLTESSYRAIAEVVYNKLKELYE